MTEPLGARSSCRYLQEQDEAAARQRFERQASRLHHLVSTSAIPSIYSSPYAVLTGSIPLVEGVPLEEHIRTLSKGLVRHTWAQGRQSGFYDEGGAATDSHGSSLFVVHSLLGAVHPSDSACCSGLGRAVGSCLQLRTELSWQAGARHLLTLNPLHGCSAAARPAAGQGRGVSCHR